MVPMPGVNRHPGPEVEQEHASAACVSLVIGILGYSS